MSDYVQRQVLPALKDKTDIPLMKELLHRRRKKPKVQKKRCLKKVLKTDIAGMVLLLCHCF